MPEDDNDEQGNSREPLDPKIREQLKRTERLDRELQDRDAELAALKRDSAFDKAGISESGMGALFRKAYDGDLTKEAIVQQAIEFGVITGSGSENADELAALRNQQDASAAGGATNVEDPGAKFLRDLDAAKSSEEIMTLIAHADPSLGVSVPTN
jgi:hypothetical protein